MKKIFKLGVSLFVVMTLLTIIASSVFAAEPTTVIDNKVQITDSAGTGSVSNGVYTATVKGNFFAGKSSNITILNPSGSKANISFDYSASGHSSFSINGSSVESGSYNVTLDAGGSAQNLITISAARNKTATLTISNVTYREVAAESNVNIDFDNTLGTVTVDGVSVETGASVAIGAEGVSLAATPVNGAEFIGWVDENGYVRSTSATYTQTSDTMTELKALFYKDSAPFFLVDDKYIFTDLTTATANGTKIALMRDAIFPAGKYTIPAGKTLLIPFDDANTMYTTVPGYNEDVDSTHAAPYIPPTVYRTLTMESGANITVNGAISVSAKQSSAQGTTGHPTGAYGLIDMKSGSSITVNNGGKLYVWGYIAGQGKITAESGATVYESFQIADWRGGTAISGMVDNKQKVFPMSQYYVQNIEVPLTLKSGAVENGYTLAFVSYAYTQGCSIPFIGPNGMFNVESGSITKDYDEENDRLVIDVNNGILGMSPISLSMKLSLIGTKTITSQNYVLPINGNITLNVNSGSTINLSQDIALLPGGEINVYKDATCTFDSGKKVFIYDVDNWGPYCDHTNVELAPVEYSHGGLKTRTAADLKDAKIYIEGIVDASEGEVYVTEAGANIRGGEGGVVRFNKVEDTVTYQATYYKESAIDDDPTTYHEIPVTTAKLNIGDDEYMEHDGLHTEFYYAEGAWNPRHNYVNYICGCGKKKIITSTGHSVEGENIIITPTIAENDDLAKVIMVAVYDSSYKLLDSETFLKNELDSVTFSNKDVNKIKVFAWGGFDTIEPIALAEEISVAQ